MSRFRCNNFVMRRRQNPPSLSGTLLSSDSIDDSSDLRMTEPNFYRLQHGFIYIGLMILIALLGIGIALTGQVWHASATREKERDLLFVGGQFRKAIEMFHARNRGTDDGYPRNFDELIRDPHQPSVRRYLRRIYRDPMTSSLEWGLIKSAKGGIVGVYSLAKGVPLKQAGFPAQTENFAGAGSYAEWKFIADPGEDKRAPEVAIGDPKNQVPNAAPNPDPTAGADPSDRDPGIEQSCAWVAANDLRLCNQEKLKWHDAAVACFASMDQRASSCAGGINPSGLPALAIRYGSGR